MKLVAAASAAMLAGMLAGCATIDGLIAYHQLGCELSTAKQVPPGRLDVVGNVPVLHVYGTPAEMGKQYGTVLGRALRAESRCIHDFLPGRAVNGFLTYANAHEVDLPAEVREELKAMSEASGVKYEELVALNIVPKVACSALAVWDPAHDSTPATTPAAPVTQPTGGLIMGRNADYYSFGFKDRGSLLVVRHPPAESGKQAIVCVSFLGMVGGFTGMNEKGVAFANMLVFNGPPGAMAGPGTGAVTIQLAMRIAAEKSATVDDMAKTLQGQTHLIPMLVMLADERRAEVLELGPDGSRERTSDNGILAASNYFRTEMALKPVDCPRFASLMESAAHAAAEHGKPEMSLAEMEAAVRKAAIMPLSLQAIILEPQARRMHVSINRSPAAAGPYTTFDLRELMSK